MTELLGCRKNSGVRRREGILKPGKYCTGFLWEVTGGISVAFLFYCLLCRGEAAAYCQQVAWLRSLAPLPLDCVTLSKLPDLSKRWLHTWKRGQGQDSSMRLLREPDEKTSTWDTCQVSCDSTMPTAVEDDNVVVLADP